MAVYIAFLRGVNVGTKNRVKMEDLKHALESADLSRAETYIQSGNIVFESEETEVVLREKIETIMESAFGISTPVILRTAEEMRRIINEYPFSKEEAAYAESINTEGESRYISLLAETPSRDTTERLNAYAGEDDKHRVIGRNIYLLFSHSIRTSKLANYINRLSVPSTVRNWKTMSQLCEMINKRV